MSGENTTDLHTSEGVPLSAEYKAAVESSMDCFFLLRCVRDGEGRITDFRFEDTNPRGAAFLDDSAENIRGQLLCESFPINREPEFFNQYIKVVETGEALVRDIELNEEYFSRAGFFRQRVVRASDGIVITLRSIWDSSVAEDRFHLAIRASNDGFWDWRASDGDSMWWSDGIFSLLSLAKSEFVPMWSEFLNRQHPEDRKRFKNLLLQQSHSQVPISAELRFKVGREGYRWFRLRARALFSQERQVERLVGSLSEIEEQKQAENLLRNLNEQLEHRVEERTRMLRVSNIHLHRSKQMLEEHNDYLKDFAAFASHDLREPLRKIRAYGDLLQEELAEHLNEDARDYLDRMLNASMRMQSLIDDLLVYARATGRQADSAEVNLDVVLKDVLSDLEVAIEEAQAEITVDPLPLVSGTQSQFRQVFQNLIANAVKYRERDRPIRVHVSSTETELCMLNVEKDEPSLIQLFHRITVRDNGIGFEQRFADRIFAPFKRLNNRKVYSGSGIGLAVCKRIIDRHEGMIYAQSKPGEGTSIHLLLPTQQ